MEDWVETWEAENTCVNGTRGCRIKGEGHRGCQCDEYAANRVEGFEGAVRDRRLLDAMAAKRAALDFAKEERLAWDSFAAGASASTITTEAGAAEWADILLEERRKRFGGPAK